MTNTESHEEDAMCGEGKGGFGGASKQWHSGEAKESSFGCCSCASEVASGLGIETSWD